MPIVYCVNSKRIKLSEFAKQQGIAYISAYKMWSKGQIEGVQLPSGTILVSGWHVSNTLKKKQAIIYNRISPNKASQDDGSSTIEELKSYANDKGYDVIESLQDIAYSFSSEKPALKSLLQRKDWDVIVINSDNILMPIAYNEFVLALALSERVVETISDSPVNDSSIIEKLLNNVSNLLRGIIGMPSYKKPIQENIKKLID